MPPPTSGIPDPIRVVLIEDNPADVVLMQEMLADSPVRFAIEHFDCLEAALTRLNSGNVHVVVSDLGLPDSKGMDTFRALFNHPAKIPIIVLSGLMDESLALEAVQLGAQDYLVKGQFNEGLLARAIRYAITRAEADRAIADERNLLRSVLDNLIDAVYVKDRDGKYVLGNAAHARQVGVASPDQVIGKTSGDIFSEEMAAKFRKDDEAVMESEQPIINRHEKVQQPNRPIRWLSTTKVPLRDAEGQVIGIIGIGRDITARKQAEEQLEIYTQELQQKNAEMAGDLEMAREVQQAFLPQQFPTFPRGVAVSKSALKFYSRYLPTTTLGGDFFHVLPITDTKAGVLICDVMGHGVRAALVTAIQRALVEELTECAERPGEFLTQMNQSLVSILRRAKSPMFASAFYVVVDVENGRMCYANAGHPRAVHLKRSANTVSLLDGPGVRPGPALGVFENTRYAQEENVLKPRDLLLLFTDGLYEVENARGEFYDQDMLVSAIKERVQKPAEQIFEQTLDIVRDFSATKGFIDDVCLVGVELTKLVSTPELAAV